MVSGRGLLGGILVVSLMALIATKASAQPASAPAAPLPPAPPSSADAASHAPPVSETPRLHHAPRANARVGASLELQVTIEHPELVRYVGVIYRTAKGALRAVPFLRSAGLGYAAVIPAEDVVAPGLGYTIEMEQSDGRRVAVFASRSELQPVVIPEDRADARERALSTRLGDRRSVAKVTGEYVGFGTTTGASQIRCASGETGCTPGTMVTPSVQDQYWRLEGSYTYRPLRAVAEFGLRMGVIRGRSLVQLPEFQEAKYAVGLNYGSPWVRFRFADAWHLEVSVLSSISEVGFAVGGGNSLLIGDPYGTKLTLGWDFVGLTGSTYFGSRFFTRLDMLVTPGLILGPSLEITDMPHAESYGVRLLADASITLWKGLGLGIRGGYQARKSTSGGPAAGASLSLGF